MTKPVPCAHLLLACPDCGDLYTLTVQLDGNNNAVVGAPACPDCERSNGENCDWHDKVPAGFSQLWDAETKQRELTAQAVTSACDCIWCDTESPEAANEREQAYREAGPDDELGCAKGLRWFKFSQTFVERDIIDDDIPF